MVHPFDKWLTKKPLPSDRDNYRAAPSSGAIQERFVRHSLQTASSPGQLVTPTEDSLLALGAPGHKLAARLADVKKPVQAALPFFAIPGKQAAQALLELLLGR
jgi:hypothetical protein